MTNVKGCLLRFWRFKADAEIVNFIWLLFVAKLVYYSSIFYGNYGNIQLFNVYILVHYEIPFYFTYDIKWYIII